MANAAESREEEVCAERLRVGLIGPGRIARLHMDAIKRIPRVDLVAVAGSSLASAQRVAAEWDIPNAYGDYRLLLDNPDIQAVHIATRNESHCAISMAALQAGKHVICEKPLGVDAQQSGELLRYASGTGLVHAVCYVLRFYPVLFHLRAMIQQGQLGTVHTIHGGFLQDWLLAAASYDWRVDARESGPSRAMSDIGTHWLDMVQFLTGLTVSSVSADMNTIIRERCRPAASGRPENTMDVDTEDSTLVLLDFQGRAKGCCIISQVAAGHKMGLSFELDGTQASARWDAERPNELWIGHHDRPSELLFGEAGLLLPEGRAVCGSGKLKGGAHTWHQFLDAVYAAVRRGDPFDPTAASFATFIEGDRDMRIVDAIIASHRQRKWVDVASASR